MNRLKMFLFSCMAVVVMAALCIVDGGNVAQARSLACSWQVVSSPNTSTSENHLVGVAATSPNSVWAVGNSASSSQIIQTLIEEWNGSSWNIVASPNNGTSDNYLTAITAVPGTNQLWAVGDAFNYDTSVDTTLTEHWNGTAWSIASSPNPSSSFDNALDAVTNDTAGHAWAVGEYYDSVNNTIKTLTEYHC